MKREMHRNRCLLAAAVVLVLSSVTLPASAGERPLSDFLSRQGHWCAVFTEDDIDCAASYYTSVKGACNDGDFAFVFPHFMGAPEGYVAVDFLGEFGDFGTTVDGNVSEHARPDGTAEVTFMLRSHDALMQAFNWDGQIIFGGNSGTDPTLGEAKAIIIFSNTAPGAPLPDLHQLHFCPAPGQAEKKPLTSWVAASGPIRAAFGLPDGTPGRLNFNMNLVIRPTGK
jgi:hypothetical protein